MKRIDFVDIQFLKHCKQYKYIDMTKKKATRKTSNRKKQTGRFELFSFKRFLLRFILPGTMWAILAIFIMTAWYAYDLPDVSKIHENTRQPSITLYDRNNNVIATIGDLYGDYVKYKEFPKNLIDAVTSTEDRRFFKHSGVDIQGLVRAFFVNLFAGHVVQGGSTITQQLAKNVYLSHERTLKRKIQELALALYLENKFTKEQILTMYLNRIYMGSGNYGVDAAAKSYFGKNIKDINLYEAAILAGLIKAPSRYSPSNNPKLALERAEQVLINMVDNDIIKESKLPAKGKLSYNFQPAKMRIQNKAPYFTDWVREQLPDYIGQYTSGTIEIYTTIDTKLQQLADKALTKSLALNGTKHNVSQGAMVAMSPNGAVLAMSGGKSYAASQFNRVTQALRQPGSAFKLFVYLAALENGYNSNDTVTDSPIKIKNWQPENYDNKYIGEVSLSDALAKSINTVAIKLAKDVGMAKIRNLAAKLGISAEINNDLSSALGTSEVTLLELTGAYAHLANYGNAVWVHAINKILVNGETAYKRESSGNERILSVSTTAQMNEMLMHVVNEGTGQNAKLPYDVAGKTGTTQNLRDAWFIGFTGDYVAGVWMGNDDNKSMDKIAGGSFPALIWKEFMRAAQGNNVPNPIPTSAGNVSDGRDNGTKDNVWDGIVNIFGDNKEGTASSTPQQEEQQVTEPVYEEPVYEESLPEESLPVESMPVESLPEDPAQLQQQNDSPFDEPAE